MDLRKVSKIKKDTLWTYARKQHRSGKSIKEISDLLGIHRTTISRWVHSPTLVFSEKKKGPKFKYPFYIPEEEKILTEISYKIRHEYPNDHSLWKSGDIQKLLCKITDIQLSRKFTNRLLYKMFDLPPKDKIKPLFHKEYPCLNMTLSKYSQLNSYRCYYFFRATTKYLNTKESDPWNSDIFVIYSPRGDIRISQSSYAEVFKRLIDTSKNKIIIVYDTETTLNYDEEILRYTREYPQILLLGSDEGL